MALVRSIAYSILASFLATVALRRILSVSQPGENGTEGRAQGDRNVVIIIPIVAGNNNNRTGWVKEVHHHHHSLFGRAAARRAGR